MIKVWLPLAVAITVLSGVIYAAVQQDYRLGADDPQIQLAEQAAFKLAAGESIETVLPNEPVVLERDLAPYLILFDADKHPLASNATLHGQIPSVPPGVLDAARLQGQNKVTWQPEAGVRSATVSVPVDGGLKGYVLAGRSLREVEKREAELTTEVGVGWLAALLATLVTTIFTTWVADRMPVTYRPVSDRRE